MKITLSDGLKKQLEDEFLPPVNRLFASGVVQNPNANGLHTPEAKAIKNNHRNNILNQGRTDFAITSDGLTPAQKVDLYCFYYFQMHFTSSYRFYLQEKDFLQASMKGKSVYFIDIGCGPFTSGLAFNSWLSKFADLQTTSINYFGVDISKHMIEKAKSVASNTSKLNFTPVFFEDKDQIIDIRNIVQKDILIILNYSYLFASNSLVVEDFLSFTRDLLNTYCNQDNPEIGNAIILQQNPRLESLNLKWINYKSQLPMFASKEQYPQLFAFQFDDALGSSNYPSPSFNVRCDLLKSF